MVRDICEELGQNFIDYAFEVNSCRAFADARDGLKPGQRACLWEMFQSGYNSTKPHVKSAKIAGAVTGSWWPHGDVAIYETFARMSQPWINNVPEVDWHGNNGSQFTGPECASARYTEARLSKFIEKGMFEGIKKNNVKMIPNYSEDMEWPEVLPAVFPRLIVNGCQGIGSTIANNWLPHSLTDISAIIIKYMTTGTLDFSNLYPSFPTGGIIINKKDIHKIYEEGKGKVILRGKAEVKGNKILITELPYQIYAQPYVEKITEMAIKDELTGIEAVYNKSGKNKLLIEIECSDNAERVLRQLYAKTDLQKNYNANQWALVGKTPKLLNLKEYLDIYLAHNSECISREFQYDKEKAEARLNIVEGLLKALDDIDNIIVLIKGSESAAAAKQKLIEKYQLNELQAKAILDMKLSKLAKLEKTELVAEKQELINTINYCEKVINSKEERQNIISTRLTSLTAACKNERVTEVVDIEIVKEDKEVAEVPPEDVVVILNQAGEIKRVPKTSFKVQRRNGKGIKNKDEAILSTISTNTIDNLMLFTNKGRMFKMLVDNIPAGTNATKGIPIETLIKAESGEKVVAASSVDSKADIKYVVFITEQGMIKKTSIEEYKNVKRGGSGIIATKIAEGDFIVDVLFMKEEELVLITKKGMSIRFETKTINAIGRAAAGVKSIKLEPDDKVIAAIPVIKDTDTIAIFAKNGLGKKIETKEIPLQGRVGKGVFVYKATATTGDVIGGALVKNDDAILLVGQPNSICISAIDIPLAGRVAQGNILLKDSKIQSITKI